WRGGSSARMVWRMDTSAGRGKPVPAPLPERQAPSAVAAAWLLGLGLLGSGVLVGLLLLRPVFGLPSWWYALPVVAPYFVLGVAAVLARRYPPVLAAGVACLGLGCAAALLAAGLFGFDEAWQRGISGTRDSGSGEQAQAWFYVA